MSALHVDHLIPTMKLAMLPEGSIKDNDSVDEEPVALPPIQYFTLEQLNAVLNNEQIYENKDEQHEVSSYFKSRLDFNPFDLVRSVDKEGNSYHTTFS